MILSILNTALVLYVIYLMHKKVNGSKTTDEIIVDIKVNSEQATKKLGELERACYNLEQRLRKIS
jgi:hypothetical protein